MEFREEVDKVKKEAELRNKAASEPPEDVSNSVAKDELEYR